MSGLSEAEREALAAAMHDAFQGWKGDPRGTTCGDCEDDASMLAPFVGQIIAARVTAALTEAADDPALRLTGHSGISIRRLRERAAAIPTDPARPRRC